MHGGKLLKSAQFFKRLVKGLLLEWLKVLQGVLYSSYKCDVEMVVTQHVELSPGDTMLKGSSEEWFKTLYF